MISCTIRSVVQCCSPSAIQFWPIVKVTTLWTCGHLASSIKAEWVEHRVHFCPNLQPLNLHRRPPVAFIGRVAFVKILLITTSRAASHKSFERRWLRYSDWDDQKVLQMTLKDDLRWLRMTQLESAWQKNCQHFLGDAISKQPPYTWMEHLPIIGIVIRQPAKNTDKKWKNHYKV